MSINSMTSSAAFRKEEIPLRQAPFNYGRVEPSPAKQPQPGSARGNVDNALSVVFGYIPTEIITLYVAVLASLGEKTSVDMTLWITFSAFLAATPAVVWVVYAAKLRAANKPLPLNLQAWPLWEMCGATLAFFAWACALPQSPFSLLDWYSAGLAGINVLIVSTVLGLLAPLFQRKEV